MNHHLQSFAREFIMDGLNHLPREWVDKFRRIHLPRLVDPTIKDMAYAVSAGSLDNAMNQVEKSIHTFKVQCGYTPRKLITNGTPDIQPGDRVDFGPIERWSSRTVLAIIQESNSVYTGDSFIPIPLIFGVKRFNGSCWKLIWGVEFLN